MIKIDKIENDKKKAGRPKGAKSKLNLPIRDIADAVEWIRKVDNEAKGNEFHPEDLVEYIGINKGFVSPALSVLQKFGFIERGSFGWKVSELGMRVISNEREAIKEALERVDLYRDLLKNFGDKNVTKTIILNYLKTKYKKGENTEVIAGKYTEAVSYLNSLTTEISSTKKDKQFTKSTDNLDKKIITLLKLKYMFFPEKDSKIEVIDELINVFEDETDPTIKSVISKIKQQKGEEETLKVLINILFDSFKEKYSILATDRKYKKDQIKKEESKHNTQSD